MCFIVLWAGAGVVAVVVGAVAVAAGVEAWANATVANSDAIRAAASFFKSFSREGGGEATNLRVAHPHNASDSVSLTSESLVVLGTGHRLFTKRCYLKLESARCFDVVPILRLDRVHWGVPLSTQRAHRLARHDAAALEAYQCAR